MEGNGHQTDSVGEQFSELLLLEVAGTVTNNKTFFFLFSFLYIFHIKFGPFLCSVKSSMICHAVKYLLFKVALFSVLYFCFNDLSTQNFEIIDAFHVFSINNCSCLYSKG
jgi:hypothetical protein